MGGAHVRSDAMVGCTSTRRNFLCGCGPRRATNPATSPPPRPAKASEEARCGSVHADRSQRSHAQSLTFFEFHHFSVIELENGCRAHSLVIFRSPPPSLTTPLSPADPSRAHTSIPHLHVSSIPSITSNVAHSNLEYFFKGVANRLSIVLLRYFLPFLVN